MNFQEYILVRKEVEAIGICSFYFKRKSGEDLPLFFPGQYVPIRIKDDETDTFLIRNYTLSDRPGLDFLRITVKKEENGRVSSFLHDKTKVGDSLWIGNPKGDFYLKDDNSPVVLISGGVGITPMISMLEDLAFRKSQRKVYFLHSSINRFVQPMKSRLDELMSSMSELSLKIHHSLPAMEEVLGLDYDKSGIITLEDIDNFIDDKQNSTVFLCGPSLFMDAIKQHLIKLQFNPARINIEFFKAGEKEGSSPVNLPFNDFGVYFKNSEIKSNWSDKHQSLLDFSESLGIFPNNNCRMGTCNTCQTKVIEGDVRYDPEPFFEPDPGNILLCCAKPVSNIILDL